MNPPWSVDVTRGSLVECRHLVHGIVITADKKTILEFGNADRYTYPRSAVKWIQALDLILSGTSKSLGLTEEQLALACSSHNGETEHVRLVSAWLDQLDLTPDDLECGISPPFTEAIRSKLAQEHRQATPIHHCCSGKHAGMLSICRQLGLPIKGYSGHGHQIQQRIRDRFSLIFDTNINELPHALDGCSVPTYAMRLCSIALGFARLGAARFDDNVNQAGEQLMDAQTKHAFLVAGTERLDSALLEAGQGRLQIKMGAGGVYCGALPDRELGFALKCEDGAQIGQEFAVIELLRSIGESSIVSRLSEKYQIPEILTARGAVAGSISVNLNGWE